MSFWWTFACCCCCCCCCFSKKTHSIFWVFFQPPICKTYAQVRSFPPGSIAVNMFKMLELPPPRLIEEHLNGPYLCKGSSPVGYFLGRFQRVATNSSKILIFHQPKATLWPFFSGPINGWLGLYQHGCILVKLPYFTNQDFPEIRGPIPLPKSYLVGWGKRVRSLANLTRSLVSSSFNTFGLCVCAFLFVQLSQFSAGYFCL